MTEYGKPNPKKRTALIVILSTVAVLLLCCFGGTIIAAALDAGAGAISTPTPVSTGPSTTAKPSLSSPEPTKRGNPQGIGDGQHLIGVDTPPGRYESKGPDGDYMCYWQLTTEPNAQPGDKAFLRNDVPPGHAYVDLKKGQYFTSSHCGLWTLTA